MLYVIESGELKYSFGLGRRYEIFILVSLLIKFYFEMIFFVVIWKLN